MKQALFEMLEARVHEFNHPDFIANDPIAVPHAFSKAQDIEIAGFFAAIFAWGQRTTIIAKARELMQRMDNAPYDFVRHAKDTDLRRLEQFVHRTFNDTDLLFLVDFLQRHYKQYESLEQAFLPGNRPFPVVKDALIHFHQQVFEVDWAPQRTRKHIPNPARGSASKRLCMFLRWMVRSDAQGVDFGMWKQLQMADLIMPLDLHVQRVALKLGLLLNHKADWQAAEALTETLRSFDPADPVKYDFALFGLGLQSRRGADWQL